MSTNNPSDWRGTLPRMDLTNEHTLQVVNEAWENIKQAIEIDSAQDQESRVLGRTIGGLDKSAAELAELLGVPEQYQRQYHDDGCVIDLQDEEFGGHDAGEGCEYAEEDSDPTKEQGPQAENETEET